MSLLLFFTLCSLSVFAQSQTYYIDSFTGNDLNSGFSPQQAWQSLQKVNSKTFFPGDTILFKSGSVWNGQLKLKGSGSEGKPIILDKYGPDKKPLINGNGLVGEGTVYLFNVEYWEINNLEITNDATEAGDRRGLNVAAANFGTVHHIYIKNLDIHNIKGIVGQDDNAKRTAGIGIETTSDAIVPTRYDDILIEGCNIFEIENSGLYTDNLTSRSDYPKTANWYKRCFTNMKIRNNVIHHIAKNAMIIRLFDKGVVEYNTCYETALQETGNTIYSISSDSTVFQYNEGYFNRSTGADGSLYDADLRSPNTIWQYSYSHDNAHGLFWSCTVQQDSGIIVRYNISQNDKGNIFCVNYPNTQISIYNNTVFIGAGLSPLIISERNVQTGTRNYSFFNNVIYNNSTSSKYEFRTSGYTRYIDYNVYYGIHPSNEPGDLHKITTDPKFENPGKGFSGLNTLTGYKLSSSSPCINTGIQLDNNCEKDFWGNPIPSGTAIDRGAFEYPVASKINEFLNPGKRLFQLEQNFPNPFNPATKVKYLLQSPQNIKLLIQDSLGEHIKTLKHSYESSGEHTVTWNGDNEQGRSVSSGIYFAVLVSESESMSIKMILIR